MDAQVSPLAVAMAELPPLAGVRLGSAAAGIRYRERTDLVMAELAPGTTVAGVFTRSQCPGAPVDWCRTALRGGRARAVVVNSGNANVFTGRAGRETCAATAEAAAALVGCKPREVFIASTGVIGEVLPHERLTAALPGLHESLREDGWEDAARGIMTTDTFPKTATRTARIGGEEVRISGIAKGSGMIAPDMATMLSFVFTDAPISSGVLQGLLQPLIDESFNAVTVDSDTSTSDTCLVFATGRAPIDAINSPADPRAHAFAEALGDVLHDLAMLVVRDGEGATKLVTVNVEGASSDESAFRIAKSIADSRLVKTAIAGEDANWGRVVMAVGKAGEPADRDRLRIAFGDIVVAEHGERAPHYDEAKASAYMKNQELELSVGIGLGSGRATVYTCDLTHGYIDINGSYRS